MPITIQGSACTRLDLRRPEPLLWPPTGLRRPALSGLRQNPGYGMRFSLFGLTSAMAFVAIPAFAGGLGEMTEAESAAFGDAVRAYIIAHPEVLVEAMEVLQSRDAQASVAKDAQILADNAAAIFNDPASWVGGNPDGDVTVVEFTDYQCSYCRKAHDEVKELVASDGNIRFVLKEFPILGEDSVASSRFAIAVLQLHGDAAYATIHSALITLRGAPSVEVLTRLATENGLEAAPILARMGQDEVTAVIAANHALADAMEISGTPTFVVNGTILRGYLPLDEMRDVVAGERG